MFKRIENRLRKLIAEELAKTDVSLANECKQISDTFSNVQVDVSQVFSAMRIAEFAKQVEKVLSDRLKARAVQPQAAKEKPSHWKADDTAVKADHALRKGK